jgi:hypothetical protein
MQSLSTNETTNLAHLLKFKYTKFSIVSTMYVSITVIFPILQELAVLMKKIVKKIPEDGLVSTVVP